jgi:hypothetical protein
MPPLHKQHRPGPYCQRSAIDCRFDRPIAPMYNPAQIITSPDF